MRVARLLGEMASSRQLRMIGKNGKDQGFVLLMIMLCPYLTSAGGEGGREVKSSPPPKSSLHCSC